MRLATPGDNASGVVQVHDEREQIQQVEDMILAELGRQGYPQASEFAIRLAFEEAITNAFEHGHREQPHESVTVEYEVNPRTVRISIEDKGPGFDPAGIPDPTLDENLDKPFGRGLMLIRSFMSEVVYNAAGNRLTMRYDRPSNGS
ncbi:MAG: ATP-binding protein [Phycisphaerales bacterium]